jgi:hypothetical protein
VIIRAIYSRQTLNLPKSEAKKMINITSRRGSAAEFMMIMPAE